MRAAILIPFLTWSIAAVCQGAADRALDDWNKGNLLANGDFTGTAGSGLPTGWSAVLPNPAVAPIFGVETNAAGHVSLTATGCGRDECLGYVRYKVHLTGGKTYRFRVQLRAQGLDDLNRHLVHGVFGGFNDGIFDYTKQGDEVIGDNRFPGPAKTENAEVRLYYRFSPAGKVWWERVSLQECDPVPPRRVKIAVSWGRGDMAHWTSWLDQAGEKKVDLALLPEIFNGKTPKDAEAPDGPAPTLLSEKAKQWKMYVTAAYYEKKGDLVFNTSRLFDRQGKCIGLYRKMQLFEPEEDEGVTPGTDLQVCDTDFGKLGLMTCYDSWFPEIARLLAYKGAELVVLPNAGYYPRLMPARASDNGICIAASSLSDPAGVWDASGNLAGDKTHSGMRDSPTMISGCERDEALRMMVATVDLSRRFSPAWHGGPMHSAPGGRRVRQSLIRPIEDEIAREAKTWWKEGQ